MARERCATSFSAFLDAKEEAAGSGLTPEESSKLSEMIRTLKDSEDYKELTLPPEETLVRFLMARKFDVERAVSLLFKYKGKFDLREKLLAKNLLSELESGKVLLPPCRDRFGAQLLVFEARRHESSSFFSDLELIRYLLEVGLASRITQRNGFTVVFNMAKSKWKAFDAKLLGRFLLHLQDHFPARIAKFLIVDSTAWASILSKAIRPLMKAKLASKLHFVESKELTKFISNEFLLEEFGGEYSFDHSKWIQERIKIESKTRVRGCTEGFLIVRGADGNWKRRWIMVSGNRCSVYKSLEDVNPLRIIRLDRCVGVEEAKTEERTNTFKLTMEGDEPAVVFQAESPEGLELWIATFRLVLSVDLPRRVSLKIREEEFKRRQELESILKERELERERLLREEREEREERERREAQEREAREREAREREEALQKIHTKRTHIVQEILWTEQSYVDTLRMINEVFAKPLKESLDSGKGIVSEKHFKSMFPELLSILALNGELLINLDERIQNWSPTQTIGDIFLKLADYLRIYVGLVNNYNTAIETINRCQQENSQFRQFLEESMAKPECKMIGLAEHLLTPIQRIPRYVLLLADLLKNTDSEHEDYNNLVSALEEVRKTADYINETKKKSDSRLRVVSVLEEVKGLPEDLNLVAPHRLLLMELEFQEFEDLRPQEKPREREDREGEERERFRPKNRTLRIYLFNDLVLVAVNRSPKKKPQAAESRRPATLDKKAAPQDLKFREFAKIELSMLSPVQDSEDLLLLQLGKEKIVLQASSPSARDGLLSSFAKHHPMLK